MIPYLVSLTGYGITKAVSRMAYQKGLGNMIDGKRYLSIKVDYGFIDAGEKQDSRHCPIANKLKSMGFNHVSVKDNIIALTDPIDGNRYFWTAPISAVKWLTRFDRGEEVTPIEIRLDTKMARVVPKEKRVSKPGPIRPDGIVKKERTGIRKGLRPIDGVWWEN